jgi:hypothetical protein
MIADGIVVTISRSESGDDGSDLRLDDEWALQGADEGTDDLVRGTLPEESDFVLHAGDRMVFIIPNERLPAAPGNYALILRYESKGTTRTAPPGMVSIGD